MPSARTGFPAEPEARRARKQTDWHSPARQAQRDVMRLNWARDLLDEESRHPRTHSVARIRRAKAIIEALSVDLIDRDVVDNQAAE